MTRASLLIVATLVVAGCGKGKGDEQTLAQAMAILCASDAEAGVENHAPAERQAAKSKWIAARLKNREARDAFAKLGDMAPAERAQLVVTLLAKAKLDRCDALQGGVAGLPPDLRVPELAAAAHGAEPLDDDAAMITVVASGAAIVLEGQSVVALENMHPPVSEMEGGAAGLTIPRLREQAKAHAALAQQQGRELAGARLVVHPDAPYKLLLELIMSIKPAGVKRYAIVARRANQPVVVPLELPEMPMSVTAADMAAPPPLGLVVAVTKNNILVFSTSGSEGTISAPKLSTPTATSADLPRVQQTLAEIHARHTDERRIVVMFDLAIPVQLVTETLAAVRATPDGGKLFTDVTLSAGFE